MTITTKKLPKGHVELAFSLETTDFKSDLDRAAQRISEERPIEGYRPGKAPYDIVKMRFGEMTIYEAALSNIVRRHYVKAVLEQKLSAFGEPKINVTKLSPGNPLEFTADVVLIPDVTELYDFRAIKIDAKTPTIEEKQVDDGLKELTRMQTRERRVTREVQDADKVIIDMDLSVDKVPIEGGQARNHGIYLNEEYYVPGLKEKLLGMKENEKKSFMLSFPETHFQKNIAGKSVDFDVTLKEIYELVPPALDDAFAASLGQASVAELRTLLKKNMQEEADEKEQQRVEIEVLEKIVDKSTFEDIPDELLNAEIERMLHELRDNVARQGADFAQYLDSIKKKESDLKLEFAVSAVKRIKTALIARDIAKREKIEVSDAEVLAEQERLINGYSNDPESQKTVRSDDYQDYLRTTLANRKVLELLRASVTKK